MFDTSQICVQIQGGIYGYLIGDAIGSEKKAQNCTSQSQVFQLIARSYSYCSATMLSTMTSINECDTIDPDDIMNLIQEWYLGSNLFSKDPAKSQKSLSEAMRLYNTGMPVDRCGERSLVANNCALVRMLPIAIYLADKPVDEIVSTAHQMTLLTNSQVVAQVCSALYCLVVKSLLCRNTSKIADDLSQYYQQKSLKEHSEALKQISEKKNETGTGSDEVVDAFWSSYNSHFTTGNNYETAVAAAIQLGGACESTAALTGSLSGLDLGMSQIPKRWKNQLELSSEAQVTIHRFEKKVLKDKGNIS